MPIPCSDPAPGEAIDRIQENLVAYFRIFAGLPGVTFVEEDVTWSVNVGGEPGNHILRTQISGDGVDRRIDELLGQIGQYTDHIDWLVFPSCRPADLGKHLQARGIKGGPGGTWMLAELASLPGAPSAPGGFHVEPVTDNNLLEEWKRLSAEGFEGDVQIYYDAYARHGYGEEAFSRHYIGYLDKEPVTSSTLLLAGGIAGIYDVSTPPSLRRQGFAGAITLAAMREARNRGYRQAWIWSSEMGKSVYRKLGFMAADFGVREYPWYAPG
jgi:hypothetical protein